MAVLKLSTPGVFVQEIPSLPPSVAEVETAIPAFIGYTEKADKVDTDDLLMIANKVNNLEEFITFYGGAPTEANDSVAISVNDFGGSRFEVKIAPDLTKRSKHNLYNAVQHFYDNGGATCYIVSVAKYAAIDKAKLKDGLESVKDIDEVTLLVVPEAKQAGDQAAYTEIVNAMIKQAYDLKDRFALIDPFQVTPKNSTDPNGDIDGDVAIIRNATLGVEENRYAAAYYPYIITTYNYNFDFDNLNIGTYNLAGSPAPGAPSVPGYGVGKKMSELGNGSLLYNKISDELKRLYVVLPPSPAIAGLYTRVDSNKGVWKAPANESLLSTVGPYIEISNREQENLNVDSVSGKSINVIRSFPGYGTVVWGARTLNGNDGEWKYISVRRFFNMVEESIKKSSQWAVFESNTLGTWVKVSAMIENYLYVKWRDGALAGSKPEQAFYVRVGLGTTMTAQDILDGRMNVEIGMAVSRPAEFIVLKFTQLLQQA
jgi:phage tail sheath protein FI